jgi:hypothetical protein
MARVREATRSEDVRDVAKRLEPYLDAPPYPKVDDGSNGDTPVLDELGQRVVTFVAVMPPHQRRATIEGLVCPHEPELGRRTVDSLIDAALVAEDERGCLRLLR